MNKHRESLKHALLVMKKHHYKKYIRAIYLFGSCARKKQTVNSDVDIFVFVDDNMPTNLIADMRSEVNFFDINYPRVDVVVSSGSKFSDCKTFNKNLEKEAILLWERQHI